MLWTSNFCSWGLSLSHKLISAEDFSKTFLTASVSYWKSIHMQMISAERQKFPAFLSTRFWVCGLLHQKGALEGNIDGDDNSRSGSTTALRETSDSCERVWRQQGYSVDKVIFIQCYSLVLVSSWPQKCRRRVLSLSSCALSNHALDSIKDIQDI